MNTEYITELEAQLEALQARIGKLELELQTIHSRTIEECAAVCESDADSFIGNTEKGQAIRQTGYRLAENIRSLQPTQSEGCVQVSDSIQKSDEYMLVPKSLIDSYPEINPSNYDHDDACRLNQWAHELVVSAESALSSPAATQQNKNDLVHEDSGKLERAVASQLNGSVPIARSVAEEAIARLERSHSTTHERFVVADKLRAALKGVKAFQADVAPQGEN